MKRLKEEKVGLEEVHEEFRQKYVHKTQKQKDKIDELNKKLKESMENSEQTRKDMEALLTFNGQIGAAKTHLQEEKGKMEVEIEEMQKENKWLKG